MHNPFIDIWGEFINIKFVKEFEETKFNILVKSVIVGITFKFKALNVAIKKCEHKSVVEHQMNDGKNTQKIPSPLAGGYTYKRSWGRGGI